MPSSSDAGSRGPGGPWSCPNRTGLPRSPRPSANRPVRGPGRRRSRNRRWPGSTSRRRLRARLREACGAGLTVFNGFAAAWKASAVELAATSVQARIAVMPIVSFLIAMVFSTPIAIAVTCPEMAPWIVADPVAKRSAAPAIWTAHDPANGSVGGTRGKSGSPAGPARRVSRSRRVREPASAGRPPYRWANRAAGRPLHGSVPRGRKGSPPSGTSPASGRSPRAAPWPLPPG